MAMEARIDLINNELGAKIAKRLYNVNLAIEHSPLAEATQRLVAIRASQINGCGWCLDIHTKEAAAAGETALRINLVAAWRHAGVFTDAERAALALTEAGTRLGDDRPGVAEATWAQAREHYDDDQLVALVSLIALINATNRLGVITAAEGGAYQPGMFAAMGS